MDKKSEQPQETHIHNAPVYNINIGYVDKQINGDYYENHYASDAAEHKVDGKAKGKAKGKGRPGKILFITNGAENTENAVARKSEAARLVKYVKEHHLSNRKLTTQKDDLLNEIIVAFIRRWQDSKLIGAQLPGASVFRFLTEDVGLGTDVTERAYSSKIKTFVANIDVKVETEKEVARSFK